MRRSRVLGAWVWVFVACAPAEPPCSDCADAGPGDPGPAVADGAPGDSFGDSAGDSGGDSDPFVCGQPTEVTRPRLWPAPGELYYAQLGLSGPSNMGEAALSVWPGGQIVLIDVGNDSALLGTQPSHAVAVRARLNEVIGAMNGGGFPPRAADTVDQIVLTHFHADHVEGLGDLLQDVTVTGRIIYRGLYDLLGPNPDTIVAVCTALASHPGKGLALCSGTAAAPCTWASGLYPSASCDPDAADSVLNFGSGSRIDILGVNGQMNGDRFETVTGTPFDADDDAENARSIVTVLRHGAFRMLTNGDLTHDGYGHFELEGFYAPRIGLVSDIDARGVDVLHAGHHGRRTSTSPAYCDRLLPKDGRARNAVMGVSEAHIRSPYQEVLDALFDGGRLDEGRAWTTRVASLGATDARLVNADGGQIIVRTEEGGSRYYVQALGGNGAVISTRRYDAVRACP